MVEWTQPFDMAWHSVTGVDHRGRWRIRQHGSGRCKIEFRFAYGVVGGGIAGLVTQFAAAPAMRRQMRRTLGQLKRQVEAEQRRLEAERRRAVRQPAQAWTRSAGRVYSSPNRSSHQGEDERLGGFRLVSRHHPRMVEGIAAGRTGQVQCCPIR